MKQKVIIQWGIRTDQMITNFINIMNINKGTSSFYQIQGTFTNPTIYTFNTLSPYLNDIDKRKKTRSMLKDKRNKNKNQTSSKSFRIKDRSASSLRGQQTIEPSTRTIVNVVNKINAKRNGQTINIRDGSRSKDKLISSKNMIRAEQRKALSRNSQAQTKNKKVNKDLSFRRNMYEHSNKNDISTTGKLKDTIELSKYGYTDTSRASASQMKTATVLFPQNKKFRKNKYEQLYSSVTSTDVAQQDPKPTRSESQLLIKKQSNFSINKEMDKQAQQEIKIFYRQMRSKEIKKSLQKSTEKYFNEQPSRMPKTKNDIEIYVSTIKNPLNRQSNATKTSTSDHENSAYPANSRQKLLNYDFQFADEEKEERIEETSSPWEEDSFQLNENGSFEQQRKDAERQFFHRQSPQIEWSSEIDRD